MEQLLTVKEIANILQIHYETVKYYIQVGRLKGIKIGYRTTRVARADLEEFIKSRHGANYFEREVEDGRKT